MTEGEASKIAAWDRIHAAWLTYCREGDTAFDWDYDSRDLMAELTGERVPQWVTGEDFG